VGPSGQIDRSQQKDVRVSMSDKKIWLVTGAGRALGVDIAKAALAAGHAVVATGRNTEKVQCGDRGA
jgi:NAD(P)-dependent dehydrogenase (short-subunit alcohol dehydrogenase family)